MPRYYFRSQVTCYVILFIERDGSTYLSSMLKSHPQILAQYEQFAVLKQQGASGVDQLAWLRGYFTPSWLGRAGALGFKTKLVDVLDPPGFVHLLQKKRCRIIQLRRLNRVKAVISRINARKLYQASGKWNLYEESDRIQPEVIDPEEFDRFLHEREQADNELQSFTQDLGLPTLEVVYEQLLLEKEAVLRQVLDFLRVPALPLAARTLKHTRDNLREVVLNFDELRARYAGTEVAAMFDEVLTA